jgi:tRNA pseudouridine55 synthase
LNGFLVVDKPSGLTSRDAVNRVQRRFPRKTNIGHTGTLDPLATGVLVLCVGTACKLADRVQAMPKTYVARFRLGATSTTDDADGTVTPTEATMVLEDRVRTELAKFVGVIDQVPPQVSAIKVEGTRAYASARRGQTVSLTARPVRVDAIRVHGYAWPFIDIEIDCGKGTYVRSIARDLGRALGCGGLVESLRRTRVGPFTAEQGIGPDSDGETMRNRVIPPDRLGIR